MALFNAHSNKTIMHWSCGDNQNVVMSNISTPLPLLLITVVLMIKQLFTDCKITPLFAII